MAVKKKKIAIISGISALALAGGAVAAYASIPDGSGVYHACVENAHHANGRMVKILDTGASETCQSGWSEKTWNQVGPQGPQGPQGDPGSDASVPAGTLYQLINREERYPVAAHTKATDNGHSFHCNTGEIILSSYSVLQVGSDLNGPDFGSDTWLDHSALPPDYQKGPTGAAFTAWNTTDNDGELRAIITCAKQTSGW